MGKLQHEKNKRSLGYNMKSSKNVFLFDTREVLCINQIMLGANQAFTFIVGSFMTSLMNARNVK